MDKTIYKSRLRNKGQVTVPPEIRNQLGAEEGDDLLFFTDEAGGCGSRAQIIHLNTWFWSERCSDTAAQLLTRILTPHRRPQTIYKSRLRNKGQVTVPPEIRNLLGAEEGDDLLFYTDEAGRVVVSRAQIIDPEQAWFWSERWQRMEQQAQADLETGRILEYANIAKALAALDEILARDEIPADDEILAGDDAED